MYALEAGLITMRQTLLPKPQKADVSHGELFCTRFVTLIWTGNELLNIKCCFAVIHGSFKLTDIVKRYNLFLFLKNEVKGSASPFLINLKRDQREHLQANHKE